MDGLGVVTLQGLPINASADQRCCINQREARFPQPQTRLCHSHRLRAAQFGKPIEDGGSDVQLVDLPLKRARHHPLAQPLNAVHLGLHQAAPVVTAPALPEFSTEAPACGNRRIAVRKGLAFAHPGIFSWGNDGSGIALHHGRMHGLRVISPIACHCQKWLLDRYLL